MATATRDHKNYHLNILYIKFYLFSDSDQVVEEQIVKVALTINRNHE